MTLPTTTPLPPSTKVTVFPSYLEYRQVAGGGVRVVRIYPSLSPGETRLHASYETFRPDKIVEPMSLTTGEIRTFLTDATVRWTSLRGGSSLKG